MRNENRELKKEALNQLCKDTEPMPAFEQVMASSVEELEAIVNRKYEVLLMAHGNPDHGESPDETAPRFKCLCGTIEGCGEMVRRYIDTFDSVERTSPVATFTGTASTKASSPTTADTLNENEPCTKKMARLWTLKQN